MYRPRLSPDALLFILMKMMVQYKRKKGERMNQQGIISMYGVIQRRRKVFKVKMLLLLLRFYDCVQC